MIKQKLIGTVSEVKYGGPVIRLVNRIAGAIYEAGYGVRIGTYACLYAVQPSSQGTEKMLLSVSVLTASAVCMR